MNENYENNNDLNTEPVNDDVVTGVENAPKKKKGAKIAAIGIGAVVLLAGGSVAAYNLSDFVKNQVKLATLEPQEYYAWVTEKSAAESAESASETYQRYIDALSDGQKSSVSLKYEASDTVKETLLTSVLETGYEENASGDEQALTDFVNKINSIEVGMDASVKDGLMSGSIYGSFNDDKLISADVAVDYGELAYYMRIPELKEQWLGMSLSDYVEYESDEDKAAMNLVQDIMKDPEKFLTAKELEELINKYTAVWNSEIDDVELEKKEKIDIGDITVEYTVITAEIDGKTAYGIAEAFLDKASDDKLLKEIVTERLGTITEDEYDSFFEEILADLESSKEDGLFDGDEAVELTTYVDQKGIIRGMGIEAPDEEGEYSYIIGIEDDDVYGELIFQDGSKGFSAVLNAEKNGKTYDGDIEIEDQDGASLLSIEFDDFEIVNEEKFFANGDVRIIVQNIAPISLNLSSDGKSQDISIDLNFAGTDYGKLTLSMTEDKADDITLPNADDVFMIDPENPDIDIEKYVTEDEIKSFISDLLVKIGIDQSYADEIIEGEIFGGNDDYYDDYDWDIPEDNDWDDYDDDTYDYDVDDNYNDDFYDDYDWNVNAKENPDAANSVEVQSGEAYINVMDYYWDSQYWGDDYDNLSYNAGVAKINGNGQYTVSVTADSDGYRYDRTGDTKDASVLPNGIDYMSVCIMDGDELFPNACITIDSVKIDGKDVKITGKNFTSTESYYIEALIYCDWYDPEDPRCADGDISDASTTIIDGESIEEWTTIEITFTVSGV